MWQGEQDKIQWVEEDWNRDARISRTKEEIRKAMSSIYRTIEFTTESQHDFADDFMPTLDSSLKLRPDGTVGYRFMKNL